MSTPNLIRGASRRTLRNHSSKTFDRPRLAVIGGGLAGLAAAAEAVEQGFSVEIFDGRPRLGGRAGSFRDPVDGGWIDYCQHVAMGCCTKFAQFRRRTRIDDCFQPQRRLNWIGPDATLYSIQATPLLPAPLHLLGGLLRLGFLSWAERLRVVRTLRRLTSDRLAKQGTTNDRETIGQWLRRQGETPRAMEHFWSVILVSALGETLDRAAVSAAAQVFRDGFCKSRGGYELELPRAPLAEVFDRRVGNWLVERGVVLHRRTRVLRLEGDARGATALVTADHARRSFDAFVVAVPWRNVCSLLSDELRAATPSLAGVDGIESAPITAVHLWLDRPLTPLANAVLVGRRSQWLFRPTRQGLEDNRVGQTPAASHYHQVVISGSRGLLGCDRTELARAVHEELSAAFPAGSAVSPVRLRRSRVVTVRHAVFSVCVGVDRLRPPQATPVANLALAGDWTRTGWPSTMEGAVRSGYLAMEALDLSKL